MLNSPVFPHCVPLRLFDCLGLHTAAFSTARVAGGVAFFFLLVNRFRSVVASCVLAASCGGSGEARKNTEGDGMVIVSAIGGAISRRGTTELQNWVMFGGPRFVRYSNYTLIRQNDPDGGLSMGAGPTQASAQ